MSDFVQTEVAANLDVPRILRPRTGVTETVSLAILCGDVAAFTVKLTEWRRCFLL
jgi:hypothetical protein